MSSSSESIETDRDSHATVESLPEVRARGHGKCVHEYIINIFREIMVAEDWISRARLQDRLNSLLSLDGRTFFDYHASALFSDLKIHTSLDLSGIEFWPGMGCIEQDFWASESDKIKSSLDSGTLGTLSWFRLAKPRKSTRLQYPNKVAKAIRTNGPMYAAQLAVARDFIESPHLEDMSKQIQGLKLSPELPLFANISSSEYPITQTLLDGESPQSVAAAIPLILKAINSLIRVCKGKITAQGRVDGMRINYDNAAYGFPSIGAYLSSHDRFVPHSEFQTSDPWEMCERLLCPLVDWNRHLAGVSSTDADFDQESSTIFCSSHGSGAYTFSDYDSRLHWLGETDSMWSIFPGDWSDCPENIVQFLMQKFQAHIHKIIELNGRFEPLSHAAAIAAEVDGYFTWLADEASEWGLLERLHACFAQQRLRPYEYIELIEQEFYWLHEWVYEKSLPDPLLLTESKSASGYFALAKGGKLKKQQKMEAATYREGRKEALEAESTEQKKRKKEKKAAKLKDKKARKLEKKKKMMTKKKHNSEPAKKKKRDGKWYI